VALEVVEGAQSGSAYLVYTDEHSHQRTFTIDPEANRVRIGRGQAAELRLAWDREVSRVHAELERLNGGWAVIDDGLSSNGTFVNGQRLRGRRRLSAGDEIRVGRSTLTFRTSARDESATFKPGASGPPVELSRMQRRVLIALCRSYRSGPPYGAPVTNQQIAEELHLSVDAVKMHLRAVFRKLAIGHLPQNQKRARLVELAFEQDLISGHDLTD
jgi:pSer/pThr/pTyr-binding forkhead associated (FHA) protein